MQEDIILQISNRLKDIRKEKNITLQELAESAGVTKSMLSQVENSRSVPSLGVLLNLIKALDIDLNEFFKNITLLYTDKVILKKKDDYQPFEKENATGFHYQRLFATTVHDYHIDFVLLRIEADAQRPMVETNAFEFKYLIRGKVEYLIGDKVYTMEEGDSIFFDAKELHIPKSVGKEDALLLVIYFFNENKL
jgi:transcriptional regulator with XRE-family HTH domain